MPRNLYKEETCLITFFFKNRFLFSSLRHWVVTECLAWETLEGRRSKAEFGTGSQLAPFIIHVS